MRHHRFALVTAAAIAVVPFTPLPAAAVAGPARTVAPADAASSTLVKHVVTDVDGDGTRDSVDLKYLGSNRFELSATTTTGKTAKVRFTSRVDAKWAPAADTWYGASAIDGRKGSELIVNRFTKKTAESRNGVALGVYTWRSGKLVKAPAPATPKGKTWIVNATNAFESRGYNFFTKSGHRYVDAVRMTKVTWHPWKGKITRSVWRNGKWVKVSTRTAKSVKNLNAWSQVGVAGPNLLLGQVSAADIDADGRNDLVAYYQDGFDHHLLRLTTAAGTTVSTGYRTNGDVAFVGTAGLDGVPGAEIIAMTSDEGPVWKVLTWRNGSLANAKVPALYGGEGNSTLWQGISDESITNFRFYDDSGSRYALTGWISFEDESSHAVNFALSMWQGDEWVKLSQENRVLTDSEWATFKMGFTVDGLVAP